jgi:hypothetical protein
MADFDEDDYEDDDFNENIVDLEKKDVDIEVDDHDEED